jgi:ComF family protein
VPICDACWIEFPIHDGFRCDCCGDGLDAPVDTEASRLCLACRLVPPSFVRAVSFGPYEGRMRQAIQALKYQGMQGTSRKLGAMLAEAISQLASDAPAEMLVVPVPLHRAKQAQRGFNQARALASAAIDCLRKSHPAWRLTLAPAALMRLRSTESQAGLTPRQRRQNVRGAFKVSTPAAVNGKHVLVIDDILTTGATARATALALAGAGAASVWVATLARARRLHRYQRTTQGLTRPRVSSLESMHSSSTRNQPSF